MCLKALLVEKRFNIPEVKSVQNVRWRGGGSIEPLYYNSIICFTGRSLKNKAITLNIRTKLLLCFSNAHHTGPLSHHLGKVSKAWVFCIKNGTIPSLLLSEFFCNWAFFLRTRLLHLKSSTGFLSHTQAALNWALNRKILEIPKMYRCFSVP